MPPARTHYGTRERLSARQVLVIAGSVCRSMLLSEFIALRAQLRDLLWFWITQASIAKDPRR